MAKVIVTGGAGFLGSNLSEELLKRGNQVICIDNLLTGSEKNIQELVKNPNFQYLKYDVSNKLPEDVEVDFVYHLASPASPNHSSKKSYHALAFETMQVNTTGTWNLAEFAVKKRAKFLFASTSEIYGDPKEHPQKESYKGNVSTTGLRSVYDESKRFGETITSAFVRFKNLDARIVRIFNTYGPNMSLSDGRAIMELTKAALKNEDFPIFGDGKQTRSFCFVSDLIEGIILAMEKGESGEVFNLGNPEEFTIIELAQKIKTLTHSSSRLEPDHNHPEDDPLMRKPDITKAHEKLGWVPKISLEEGLPLFIDYVSNQKER